MFGPAVASRAGLAVVMAVGMVGVGATQSWLGLAGLTGAQVSLPATLNGREEAVVWSVEAGFVCRCAACSGLEKTTVYRQLLRDRLLFLFEGYCRCAACGVRRATCNVNVVKLDEFC